MKTLEAEKTGTRIGVDDDLNVPTSSSATTGNLLDLDESPVAKSTAVSANQMVCFIIHFIKIFIINIYHY